MADLFYIPKAEFDRVRSLDLNAADKALLFADMCRLNCLYMIAKAGSGHIGTSFSCLDILTWLHLFEMNANDIAFSSKGHDAPALYSLLLAQGVLEFENIHSLRRLGGLPGHPDVDTPGIVTNTGSLGMGVSKAKGLARAARMDGKPCRIFVLTGDGELQEGQFWESLPGAVNQGFPEITVIVDHNKFQSDVTVAETSDLGDLEAKFQAFGWEVRRVDGHDIPALAKALREVTAAERPGAVIADTIKGKGVRRFEHTTMPDDERYYRFHSGCPTAELVDEGLAELRERIDDVLRVAGVAPLEVAWVAREMVATPAGRIERLVPAYGRALLDAARRDRRIVALDADLRLDCGLVDFERELPERFIECGIAEQDMVSQAGGLALRGYLPVCHSFACFLGPRPNEQIYNNATEKTKIVYMGNLAGVVPGGPGHSHQSVRDIAILKGVPGMLQAEPCCEAEVPGLLEHFLARHDGPAYLRMCILPCEIGFELPAGYVPETGRGCVLREGNDAVLISYGPVMLEQACRAAELLAREGVSLRVANLPWLNRVDPRWLADMLADVRALITVDNHYIEGGQGETIAAAMADAGLSTPLLRLGLTGTPPCGRNDEVLSAVGLDAGSLAQAVRRALGLAD
ncbi:Transketolase domain-containing protein [Alkalidesulfovibrio alkalitolerans DSM 16529]|uniref:Transketolase domain-containing protein n=1 Tax=Alkalidesulfovibrio alkalitolerans DSM 16529 TaxID=1121439 RepID=S7TG16_9BACT|nr:transketolase C-terminal domain-containing protein [Alkalidesulfovibrio alkalitolerans]EPR35555.1 Transketolase domain-containing protein [Alkalidesulfovibrio alkalitolerans DSM 16529]